MFPYYRISLVRSTFLLALLAITGLLQERNAFAQTASKSVRTFTYQALLTEPSGRTIPDGQHLIAIRLYKAEKPSDPGGASPIFEEDQNLEVHQGVISVELGKLNPIPTTFGFDTSYYLGISIDGLPELQPRTHVTAAPLAIHASIADLARGVVPGATGIVASINEASGPIHIGGDSTISVTMKGGTITLSATHSSYQAGLGIHISNDTISASYPPPVASTLNSTLRFDGTTFVENQATRADPSGNLLTDGALSVKGRTTLKDSLTILYLRSGVLHSTSNGLIVSNPIQATELAGILPVASGGTGLATFPNNSIIIGNGAASPNTVVLSNGELLIGATGAAPQAATLTAGTGVSITNGAGSVTIAANAQPVVTNATLTGNGLAATPLAIDLTHANMWSTQQSFSSGVSVAGTTSPISLNGSAGTSNFVLTSQGSGVTPIWQNANSLITGLSFDKITSGTNISAAMTVGTGSSLSPSGTGSITATQFTGTGSTTNAVDLQTAEVAGTLPVSNGGTGATTLTANSILIGNGTSPVTSASLTNGQVLIGATGSAPQAATLTAGTGVSITNAAGSVTIAANLQPVVTNATLTGNGLTATPLAIDLTHSNTWSAEQLFSNGLSLSGASSPLLLNGAVGTSGYVLTTQGSGATPIWQNVNSLLTGLSFDKITSGTNISASMSVGSGASIAPSGTGSITATQFTGTGSTTNAVDLQTAEVAGTLPVSNGGTGATTLAANSILIGNGTSPITSTSLTNGQVLIGATGSAPLASTLTAGTGVTITNAAGSVTIAANAQPVVTNTTLTGNGLITTPLAIDLTHSNTWSAEQSFSNGVALSGASSPLLLNGAAGTPGYVFTSLGPGTTPVWQNANSLITGVPFDKVTTGTNVSAAMTVGTGSSIAPSGTGSITATQFTGTGSTTNAVDLQTGEVAGTLPVSNGGTGATTLAANSILIGNGAAPVTSASLTNGQVLIGSTGLTPQAATLTAGAGVSITNAAGSVTIAAIPQPLVTDATLTGNGLAAAPLAIDLLHANLWSGQQSFSNGVLLSGASSPLFLNGNPGTSSYVFTSQGSGATPIWQNANSLITALAFDKITTGTNTGALMRIGSGASITPSGTGSITATQFTGVGSMTNAVDLQTAEVAGMLPVSNGGTGASSLAANSILIGNGISPVTTASLANGQVLIGATGGIPQAATLAAGPGISVTNASGSITIAATNGVAPGTTLNSTLRWNGTGWVENGNILSTSSGGLIASGNVSAASLSASNGVMLVGSSSPISLNGSAGISNYVVASQGIGNTPIWQDANQLISALPFDKITTGTNISATLTVGSGSSITVSGSGSITATKFSGTGSTTDAVDLQTAEVAGTLAVSNGGTGTSALTANSVLIGNGTSAISAAALMDGQVLIGATGSAPQAASLTAGPGIAITNAAGSITIVANAQPVVTNATLIGNGLIATPLGIDLSHANTWTSQQSFANGLVLSGTTSPMIVNGSSGSSNFVMTSQGAGQTPLWQNANALITGLSFDKITTGTNVSAALTVGSGSSITPSGTGTITATQFIGPGSISNGVDLQTAEVAGTLAVQNGGTGTANLATNSVLIGNGTSPVITTSLANGQLLIGSTGTAPQAATLSAGTGVSITNAAGSITIAANAQPVVTDATLTGNGLATTPLAIDLAHANTWSAQQSFSNGFSLSGSSSPLLLNGAAGTSGYVLVTQGAGATPSWMNPNSLITALPFDRITTGTNISAAMTVGSGASVAPSGTGSITATKFTGTGSTTSAVDLQTAEVAGTLPVSNGGTGATTLTANSILIGNGTSPVTSASLTNGQVLIGATGSAPQASTLTAGTGVSITNAAGSVTIAATAQPVVTNATLTGNGLAATPLAIDLTHANTWSAQQSFSNGLSLTGTTSPISLNGSTGTANYVLTSQGAGATPIWQNANSLITGLSFDKITTGTNISAAMTVGSGASIAPTGTGSITATQFTGTGSTTNAVDLQTAEVAGTLPVSNGGTGATSLAANSILIGNGTSPVTSASLTNGQVLIGATGSAPQAATLTAGTGVSITNAAGSVTIAATGGVSPGTTPNSTLRWNGTNWIENANVLSTSTGNLSLAGKATSASTVSGDAGTTLVTKDYVDAASTSFDRITTGTNISAAMTVGTGSSIAPSGTGSITATKFTGTGSTTSAVDLQTAEVAGTLPVSNGGTGATTLAANSILIGNGTSPVTSASLTNGQVLIGATGSAPQAATLTAGTGVSITNAAGSVTIAATALPVVTNATLTGNGLAATPLAIDLTHANTWSAQQSFSNGVALSGASSPLLLNGAVGTSGYVLTSQGAGATPVWQNANSLITGLSFDKITTGTNISAAMTVGTGSSIAPSGMGSITATEFTGTGSTTNAVDLQTAEVAGTLPVSNGGTGATMLAANGILIGNGTSPVSSTSLNNGQILIGATGSAPQAATLTAGTGVSITNAGGSIIIAASAQSVTTDASLHGNGQPSNPLAIDVSHSNNWSSLESFSGGIALNGGTFSTNGSIGIIDQVFTSQGSGAPQWKSIDALLTAIPFDKITSATNTNASMVVGNGSTLTLSGTGSISASQFTGAGSTSNAVDLQTPEVAGILPVVNGGTGQTSLTSNSILIGNGSSPVSSASLTNGQLLIGSTGTAPAAATLTAGAGVSIVNSPGSIVISAAGNVLSGASTNTTLRWNGANWVENLNATATSAGDLTSRSYTASAGLSLTGTTSPLTLNGSPGAANYILVSQGIGATPAWQDPATILPSLSFDKITAGTSTGKALLVGAGSSISPSGSGTITANQFVGSGSTTSSVDLQTSEVAGVLPVSNGGTGSSGFGNSGVVLSNGANALSSLPLTDGALLVGVSGSAPIVARLTAGTGINIVNAPGSITLNATSGLPAGTTANSTLRFDGAQWIENTGVTHTSAGLIGAVDLLLSGKGRSASTLATDPASTLVTKDFLVSGNVAVSTDATLSGNGLTTSPLALNLAHQNVWSAPQTFNAGLSLGSSGTLSVNGSTGSANMVLTSQGSAAPIWSTVDALISTIPFASVASGTNLGQTLNVGTGSTLLPTGSGAITANRFVGAGSLTNAVDLATSEVAGILPIASGGTGASTLAANSIVVGNGTSPLSTIGLLNGQLLIGSSAAAPVAATLSAGSGIAITNAAGSVTIAATTGLPAGSTTNSTLRFNGGNWVENASVLENGAGAISATGISLTGKGTSASTSSTDVGSTLVTKDYLVAGNIAVAHDATISGNGLSASPLAIDLGHPNTWSVPQTFSGGLLLGTAGSLSTNGTTGVANQVLTSQGSASPIWSNVNSLVSALTFDKVASGTNVNQTLVVGNGSSMAATGSGSISATAFAGTGSTSGAVDLATPEVNGLLPVSNGGTGQSTLTPNAVLIGNGTNPVSSLALTNGQLLIGSTGAAPAAATLSAGSGLTVTSGAGSIILSELHSLPAGTVTNSSLRWSGTDWVENVNVTATSTGDLTLAGKGSSASTLSTDPGSTLVTKDYLTSSGNIPVTSDATLTGNGTTATPLGLDLTHSNAWAAVQSFGGGLSLIGTNSPLLLSGSAGTLHYVLTSQGTSSTPVWRDPNALITGLSFDKITTGTSTLQTLTVSDGSVISPIGTGVVRANSFTNNSSLTDAVDLATSEVNGTLGVGNGGTGRTSLAANGIVIGQGSLAVTSATLANGQILIGSTGALPIASTLTAGSGISITNAAGSITISAPAAVAGWGLLGNSGTTPGTHFAGTTDFRAFEIHVYDNDALSRGSKRVMSYEPTASSPNILGGYNGNTNTAGVVGAIIAGGGSNGATNRVTDDYGAILGGGNNVAGDNTSAVSSPYATVGGGSGNTSQSAYGFIGGGLLNTVNDPYGVVAGGELNRAGDLASLTTLASFATVSGGFTNIAAAQYSTVGGGQLNSANANWSAVLGGSSNTTSSTYSSITGGEGNAIGISADHSFVGGGLSNIIDPSANYSSIAGGQNNYITDNYSFIGGGKSNQAGDHAGTAIDKPYATVGGGASNTASGSYSAILGGHSNLASSDSSVIAGGSRNNTQGVSASILGGYSNQAAGMLSSISGGSYDTASGLNAFVGGGLHNVAAAYSGIAGGRNLTLGANSFGFNADNSGSQTDLGVQSGLAYFGNTNVILGNVDNTARELRMYGPQSSMTYTNAKYTALKAGSSAASMTYTLPVAAPGQSGQILASTTTGAMSWTSGMVWDGTNTRIGVGSNATTPNTSVDIAGDVSIRSSTLAVVANSNDVAIGANSMLRLTSTANFTITGLAGGTDGKIIVLYNASANTMTLSNDDANSLAANRIYCYGGANLVLSQRAVVNLFYSSADSHWVVMSSNK